MTIMFKDGVQAQITGGTWTWEKNRLIVKNAQGLLELEAPISSVNYVTKANLQSTQDETREETENEKKLEALEAFRRMMLGDPDDSKAAASDVQR